MNECVSTYSPLSGIKLSLIPLYMLKYFLTAYTGVFQTFPPTDMKNTDLSVKT